MGILPIIKWSAEAFAVLTVLATIGLIYGTIKLGVWIWRKFKNGN